MSADQSSVDRALTVAYDLLEDSGDLKNVLERLLATAYLTGVQEGFARCEAIVKNTKAPA